MKKKDEIILTIEDVLFPNKAYGFLDGERVIVKNTIPGQKVRATVCKKRSSGIEAQLNEILEHSPLERQEGICSHYTLCGGGTYQNPRPDEGWLLQERQGKKPLGKTRIRP